VLASFNHLPIEEHLGRTIRDISPEIADLVEPIVDCVFQTGEGVQNLEISGQVLGEPNRHWLAGFYPVLGDSGEVDAVGACVVEISERKAAEQRETLLAREVDHRAKNLLAVVQSIVQLTPTEDPELKDSIVGRIQALARAHSLLSDSRWEGVDLGQLVREELAPFTIADGDRVSHSGPSLKLRPAAAQSLALVLHELATNAAKYGALSWPTGQLRVEWSHDQDNLGAFVDILWIESGGSKIKAPQSLGFGSNIIRTSVERQLRGRVTKEWRSEGLYCTLHMPFAEIGPRPDR
jgi:two-component sensor histidine kinase